MPSGWEVPGAPDNFKGYEPKVDVDNPGKWSQFTYQPKYSGSKETGRKYVGHFMPGGATVCPKDSTGKQTSGGFELHYDGWVANNFDKEKYVRTGATSENPKPDHRKGVLDWNKMLNHGLTVKKVTGCDALFFFQLLFPVGLPSKSGVDNDHQKPFFSQVRQWSNMYAVGPGGGLGGSYGHSFDLVSEEELVKWFGVLVRDGARNGSRGAIHTRWMKQDINHDDDIINAMTFTRWKRIKSILKLNCNISALKKD